MSEDHMSESTIITIEQVEALANQIEADEAAKREKLLRLIAAYARILAVREPHHFERKPLERSDEDGHWDSSYPPKQQWKDRRGPRLYKVHGFSTEEIATTSGFYYDYRIATTAAGLYVAMDGTLWGADAEGTGRFGQFAAHPGECNVMMAIAWNRLDLDDVETEDLEEAESELRELAFPLQTQKSA